jgi:gas vesicle protein
MPMPSRIYYSEEAKRVAQQREIVRGLAMLLFGIAIGAAIAFLFAPEEGEDVRKRIGDALEEGYQRGRERTLDVVRQLEGDIPDLRKRLSHVLDSSDGPV